MMRKFKVITLVLVLTVSIAGIVACGGKGEKTPKLTISDSTYTLELSDLTYQLSAQLEYASGALSWESDNLSVASVSALGLITAVSEGEANITVKYGDLFDICRVTVINSSIQPIILTDKENISIYINGSYTLSAILRYNKKPVESTFAWTSENPLIATVENGTVVGVSYGETSITIESTYEGKQAAKSVSVKVVEDVDIQLSASSVTLTLLDDIEETVTADILENGLIGGGNISWRSDDENIAVVANGTITAVADGTVKIALSYISLGGNPYYAVISVTVKKKIINHQGSTVYDLSSSEIEIEKDFTDPITLFTIGGENVSYTTGADKIVIQPAALNGGFGEFEIRMETADTCHNYTGIFANGIIRTKAEFEAMWTVAEGLLPGDNTYGGYWVLGADINLDGMTPKYSRGSLSDVGWLGTFNGRGYEIIWGINRSAEYRGSSLFGSVGKSGVIKNVAFISGWVSKDASALIATDFYGTAQNIYVSTTMNNDATAGAGMSAFVTVIYSGAVIENSIVYANLIHDDANPETGFGYLLPTGDYSGIKNNYLISNTVTAAFKQGTSVWTCDNDIYRDNDLENVVAYTGESEFVLAQNDLSSFDNGMWTVSGNSIPTLKKDQ